ncbi:MAG: L-2-amino-thiazoline-4-carboxylic acid hydrolase [Syntrophales bacterium]|nr:L-2-amino-thiazoline-4-carboxylic acid hydrolase [Syntrophales bacterium]MDD5233389.1 L-2-amino-thiazoline-4-carboxylic acid hydrolase [Syntrophales bacterium]MDD5533127.1 L-2-amino-thiazoline-4-carboxylic acid hydrolase [Syntrophales bacterium]
MKKFLRAALGHLFMTPFMGGVLVLAVFIGRPKAVSFIGGILTAAAHRFVGLAIPLINSPEEFDFFRNRIKRNFSCYGFLYDMRITVDNQDAVQFNILNCPFCCTLRKYGFSDLSRYACAGDWVIARENRDKWTFSREGSIGTGGDFCNPKYSRKKNKLRS